MELRACKQHALQVISEENINNVQMALQRDTTLTSMLELTNTNQCMIKALKEACRMVPELAIPEDAKVDE